MGEAGSQRHGNHSIGRLTDSHTLSNINGTPGRWVNGSLKPFVPGRERRANFDTNAPGKSWNRQMGDPMAPLEFYSRTSGLWVHMTSYKMGGLPRHTKLKGSFIIQQSKTLK